MGYDSKYGNIKTQHEEIPDDEPVIMFRARDKLAVDIIGYYLFRSIQAGSSRGHLKVVMGSLEEFRYWQEQHPDELKLPESHLPHGMADV